MLFVMVEQINSSKHMYRGSPQFRHPQDFGTTNSTKPIHKHWTSMFNDMDFTISTLATISAGTTWVSHQTSTP